MLNKINRMQQKVVNLLVFIGLLCSVRIFAQSCDPYIQKALEQTHITTLPKVSYGAIAEFVIRYPLNDTKYTLTDQDGNTYVYRYSYDNSGEKITLEIPVGVITKERRFALKAENGLCSYTSSFDYTITPVSSATHELAVRVEDEWCDNAAGLFFSIVGQGANNSDYDFYYKKALEAAYPTTSLSALKVEGIGAGTYDIKAVKKTAPHTTLTQQVTIRADKQAIAYTAQYIPALCTGNGSIRVKVTSGKFPLTYTLLKADGNTVVRPRQSSNVFLDVPAGNYMVKVTDNCSLGGGNASTQVVVATNQILNFTQIRKEADRPLVHEYSCDYVAFKNLEIRGENIEKVWDTDAFPYPFEVKWEFISPTNHTYYYTKNITNRTDLEQAFKLSSGKDQDGRKFLEWKEHVYQSTPKEFGVWRITAHITACGKTQTLPYVARVAEDPMKRIKFIMDGEGGCNPTVKAYREGYEAPYIPVYYVLERYPAHFDPNAAGFYKIHTSHPDMQNKFVKLLDTKTRSLIPSGLLNVGDKVQFKVVSADCPTRSEPYMELTIRTEGRSVSPAVLYLSQVASCRGVTATGTEYASLRIENMYNKAQLTRIVITDFIGDRSKLPAGMSIPYVVSDSDRIRKDLWIIKDLPVGTYTLKYTDACGYEGQRNDAVITSESYMLSWSTDCLPKVSGNLAQAPKGNVLYSIERYDMATKSWKPASSNGNPLPILGEEGASESLIPGELKGKFRIVRRTFTHTENQNGGPYECTQVLSEKEYKGSLEGLSAVGFGCGEFRPGNPPKYHIALIPKGGHPPYTYTLVTKNGTPVNRPSTDGNFFLNVDPDNLNTRYVFKIRDNCGDERTYDEVISNFSPPQLTTSQEYYCVGQKAILSVPDLGDKIKIEWYRSDNPTHVLHRGTTLEVFPLKEADFTNTYGVRFVAEYDNDVNACIARANIQGYQLRKANDYPAFTAPNGLSLEKCAPVDTTPEIFDLNSLFINRDTTIGQYADLVVRIVDKAGVIEVPADGKVNINSPEYAGRTNTFVYEVLRPCGEVLVRSEATLKVRKTTASDKVKDQIVICQENITYGEVAQLILSQSEPAVSQAAFAFHWYTSTQDAQNEANEKQASDAIGAIPNGGNKTLYLRVQQNHLCSSAILSITLSRTSTTALAPKNLGAICALTVGELKKLIDATEHAKIILYQNGVALADAYQLSLGTSLTYSKQEGTCLTAQSPVTVTIQPHSVAEPKMIPLCTQYWKEYGFSYVYIRELRAALRALYPSAKANGIKIYDQNKNLQNDANILRVDSSALFTIEENGKCPSDYYPVTILEKEHTPAHAEALTLCPDATMGTLRTLLVGKGYTGILKIYKNDGLQMNNSVPVDWNMLDKYTFTIEQVPLCPSRHMTLSLERSTNLTPAVARTVALCSTTTPTAGQVKAAIGPSAKLYLQNGNNWDEQADSNAINLSILDKYFYTLQESGKCVSEKTPLLIAPKPQKPTGVNANQTFCAVDQKRVRDLAPQGADLRWYDMATGGTPLASGMLLRTATYYVARTNSDCESDREAVNVQIVDPQFESIVANPATVSATGDPVTLSFKGTPHAIVTFQIGTQPEQIITLDATGERTFTQNILPNTIVKVTKITNGTLTSCSKVLDKQIGIYQTPNPSNPPQISQQPTDQTVCGGASITIKMEMIVDASIPLTAAQLMEKNGGIFLPIATLTGTVVGNKRTYTHTMPATEAIDGKEYRIEVTTTHPQPAPAPPISYSIQSGVFKLNVQYLKIQAQPIAPATPYCKGATATPLTVVAAGNDTNYTYQWYQNSTNSTTGATPILGATQASYTPGTNQEGTTYYFVKVANNAACAVPVSNIIPVMVKPSMAIIQQPSNATYCQGQTGVQPFKVVATGQGLTYEWFKNTSPIIHGGTTTGVTTDTYTPNTSSTGITYYYCVVKDDCGNEERTIPVRVTINKKTTISTLPTGDTYCQNETVRPLSVVASGSGTLHYQWYQTATATNTGGTPVGEDAPNYIPSLTNAGTFYYYVEVIGQCETVRSNSITFVVKQAPASPTLDVESFNCTENTKVKVTSSRAGLTFHAADDTEYTLNGNGEITPTPAVGTHTIRAKGTNGCYSLPVTFIVKGKTAPDKPVLEVYENATCIDKTKIKIVGYEASLGYKYYLVGSPTELIVSTQGVITTDLAVGTHKLYAKKDSCDSPQSDDFTIEAPKTPVTPTLVKISDPDCTNPTLMKITNISQYTGATYTFIDIHNTAVSATVDTGTGAITDLPAGKYKLKVTQNGCTSAFSALFTIYEQFPNPAKPTIVAEDAASCDNPSTVKISNVVPTNDVSYTFTNTVTNTTVTATVNRTTGVVTGLAAGTYKVTATKGTCTETSAEFTITAAKGRPDEPTVTTEDQCDAVSTAKITNVKSTTEVPTYTFINSVTSTTVTATVDRTTGEISGLVVGKYKVTATKDGCDKRSAEFEIKAKLPVPETPTVMVAPPTCTAMSAAKVSNYTDYTHGETFTVTDSNGTAIGAVDNAGNITGLTTADTYTLTITRGTCRAAAVDFDIADKLPTPAKPAITLTPASCTSPTVAKLTQVSGLTFWHNGTQLAVNPITHEITGLAPGTYTITAKNNNNCESVASDSFEIKAQQTATTITTHPAGATYQRGDEATPLAVVATGEGTLSYKWYKNTDNNNTSGTEVGDNSPSYKPATDRVGTFYYWVEVTSDCGAVKSDVAEIKVVEGAPTIEANDDPDTTVRRGQEVAVLGNDKVNGNPATPADVDITISNDGGLTRVGVNPATGKIMIPNDAAPATYEITYKICVKNQPTICDEAKEKITVTPDATPSRPIKAVDDDFGKVPNTMDYTTTNTVFSTGVDTMEGVPGILSPETDVTLHKGAVTRQDGTAVPAGTITMNDNGSITVKQGTPVGVYTYTYSICEKAVPTNCSEEAKATFEVVDNTILAKDDEFEVGTSGGLTPSILINDILKGKVGLTTGDVEIQDTEGEARADSHLVREADGRVTVKPGIVARPEPYLYYYTIKEKANPANTSNAVIKIKVVSFTAVDDEDEVINEGTKEKKIPSVLRNDDIDGKRPEPGKNVIFTPSKVKDKDGNEVPGIVINQEDGSITIAPNTPDGVYTYSYTICKIATPNECKTAKGVLKLLPALKAVDDLDFKPVNTTKGAVKVGNVLANDEYAGKNALDHLDKVTAKIEDNNGGISGAYIDEQGNLIIPQGTPVGVYDLEYNLCMEEHPGVCKTAKVRVEVIKDKPLTIYNGVSADGDGHNDYFKIDGIEYYPKNNLKIFNRWGVLVYEKDGYSNEAPFDGHSNGRATISADSKLPQGTYYYILEYEDSDDQSHTEKGWLYLKY